MLGFPQPLQCVVPSPMAQVSFEISNMEMKLGETLKLKGQIQDNVDR